MMLVIETQVYENYAWDEDGDLGTGANAYWKAKGGSTYKVLGVPLNIDYESVVAAAAVEQDNDAFREHVISWSLEGDDYLSWFEQAQLERDGRVTYREPVIEYAKICQ